MESNCGNCANACYLRENPLPRVTEHGTVFCAHWVETMFWKDGCDAHITLKEAGYYYMQPKGSQRINKYKYDYELIKRLVNEHIRTNSGATCGTNNNLPADDVSSNQNASQKESQQVELFQQHFKL